MKAWADVFGSSSIPLGSDSPSLYVPAHHFNESSATGVTFKPSSRTVPLRDATIAFMTHMPPQPDHLTGQIIGALLKPAFLMARAWRLHSSYVAGGPANPAAFNI